MTGTIEVDHVTKRYRLGSERGNVWGIRPNRDPTRGRVVTVLHEVSVSLGPGDRLAIVGPNGAGKSTLLRLLAHVTAPSEGRIRTQGRVAPMLELGVAFHPDLTGRENVYFAGAVMGVPKAELERRYDEIVDFAGIERFMDTPVKRFSSGMSARLGFSVAMSVEADIMLIDEVLGVGDIDFRTRSLAAIRQRAEEGATIVLVSHNLGILPELCNLAMHLEGGRVVEVGDAAEVVARYSGEAPGEVGAPEPPEVELGDLEVQPGRIESAEGFLARTRLEVGAPVADGLLRLQAIDHRGEVVGRFDCPPAEAAELLAGGGSFVVEAQVHWFPLVAGRYRIDLVVEAGAATPAAVSGHLEVEGDEGSRAAQALLAGIRDHAIGSQIDWTVRRA